MTYGDIEAILDDVNRGESSKPVTFSALIRRVRRKLAHDGMRLHVQRYDARSFRDLGRYYCTDERNFVCGRYLSSDDDVVAYARELGCLGDHEYVAGQEVTS